MMMMMSETKEFHAKESIPVTRESWLKRFQERVPARLVLYFLSFTGFMTNVMMRTDINIAIVVMIKHQVVNETRAHKMAAPTVLRHLNVTSALTPANRSGLLCTKGEFNWDVSTESAILSSFYICYVLTQVVGGVLTHRFGTKIVYGSAQLITACCSLLMPTAASTHYYAIIILRCIQGLASGPTWPAMYAAVGKWVPPSERSRFMSSFQGFSFGIGLTYLVSGVVIAVFGWRAVFYFTGSLGLIWCVIWYFLAFDSPQQHPRISPQELHDIQSVLGERKQSKVIALPWLKIFTSIPIWAIIITTFGRIWIFYAFTILGPTYMEGILEFNIATNGAMSGLPFILSYFSTLAFSMIADYFINANIMTLLNTRKLFNALAQVIPGLLILGIGYMGHNVTVVLIFWFLAVSLMSAAYSGAVANMVDITPNFAGPVVGYAQTIYMCASFISPVAAGWFLQGNQSDLSAWRRVFALSAFLSISTSLVYQWCATGTPAYWNYPDKEEGGHEEVTQDKQQSSVRDNYAKLEVPEATED